MSILCTVCFSLLCREKYCALMENHLPSRAFSSRLSDIDSMGAILQLYKL